MMNVTANHSRGVQVMAGSRPRVRGGARRWPGAYIPYWVLARPELSMGAKQLYGLLATRAANSTVARNCSRSRLERDLGCSSSSVDNWINELLNHELIEPDGPRPGEQGYRYSLLRHEWMPEEAR